MRFLRVMRLRLFAYPKGAKRAENFMKRRNGEKLLKKERLNKKTKNVLLSAFLAKNWVAQIGRGIVSSADLCYKRMGDENG